MLLGHTHPNVAIRASGNKGRGVFALVDLPAGTTICKCPSIHLSSAAIGAARGTIIDQYWFENGDHALLVLGIASLLNHSWEPNVERHWMLFEGVGEVVIMQTIRHVKAGEELFYDYWRGKPDSIMPEWATMTAS